MTSPLSDGYLSSMMSPLTPSTPMANGLGAFSSMPNVASSDSIAAMVSTPNSVASSIAAALFPSVPMAAAGGHWDSVPMHFVPVQEPFDHSATGPPVAMG